MEVTSSLTGSLLDADQGGGAASVSPLPKSRGIFAPWLDAPPPPVQTGQSCLCSRFTRMRWLYNRSVCQRELVITGRRIDPAQRLAPDGWGRSSLEAGG